MIYRLNKIPMRIVKLMKNVPSTNHELYLNYFKINSLKFLLNLNKFNPNENFLFIKYFKII